MNFAKRAMTSIMRRKGKSIILFILIFVLGNVIAGAISVRQATMNVEKNIKSSMGAVATINVDYENMKEEDFEKLENLSKDKIEEIGKSEYVKTYDYNMGTGFQSNTLKRYAVEGNEGMMMGGETYFTIKGVQYAPILDIQEGKVSFKDGTNSRAFTETEINNGANVGVISSNFAELNNLHVGDMMIFQNKVMKNMGEGKQVYAENEPIEYYAEQDVVIEVIGIVEQKVVTKTETTKEKDISMESWQEEEKENTIYIPNKVVALENRFAQEKYLEQDPEMFEDGKAGFEYYTPIYILKQPEDVEKFKEEVAPLLPEFYKVIATSDTFDTIAGPIMTMKSLSTYTLYIAIGASLLILSLLIILFLRDRKHELGIYLSLGESKMKVMLQILMEVMAVAFIGITISLVSGNMIANAVSDSMIMNQMESSKNDMMGGYSSNDLSYLGYGADVTEEEIVNAYKVTLDGSYIAIFYLVGLGTVGISTIIPMVYILRLNPKKIML